MPPLRVALLSLGSMFLATALIANVAHATRAAGPDAPTPEELSQLLARRGAADTAAMLDLNHQWPTVLAHIDMHDARQRAVLTMLLRHAPVGIVPSVQARLRHNLIAAPLETIALLDPARSSPLNGARVCASPDLAWRRNATHAISATHDVVHALQRIDCLRALGVANPG